MTEKQIRAAYIKIRTIDNTIPDDVLDFMLNAAIEKIQRKPNSDWKFSSKVDPDDWREREKNNYR